MAFADNYMTSAKPHKHKRVLRMLSSSLAQTSKQNRGQAFQLIIQGFAFFAARKEARISIAGILSF